MSFSLTDPIRLTEGITVHLFDTTLIEDSYILIANGHRYEISKGIHDLIRLFDGRRSLVEVADEYSIVRGVKYTPNDIYAIVRALLCPYGIIDGDSQNTISNNNSYLYLKYPLFPSHAVNLVASRLRNLFAPRLFGILGVLCLISITIFTLYQDFNLGSINDLPLHDVVLALFLFFLTSLFHEFGHASACEYFGASHGPIGIGLYLRFPVFYSDVSDGWRLPRKRRLVVDIGGIYFQLLAALPIASASFILPDPSLKLAVLIIYGSVLFSLNPIFRFDGYWVFSDLTGVANLRRKSSEAIRYLVKRHILRKTEFKQPVLLRIRRKEKVFFYSYAVVSNGLFLLFFYHIATYVPELIVQYPFLIADAAKSIFLASNAGNLSGIAKPLASVVAPTLSLLMIGFAIRGLVITVLKSVRSRLRRRKGAPFIDSSEVGT